MTIADLATVPSYRGWQLLQPAPACALSPRESQILGAMLEGHTAKEIAFDLDISHATVRVLLSRAMRKLGRARLRQP